MSFDIIAEIAQRLEVDEEEVRPVLDSVVERIRQQVSHYGYARLAGLGTFRGRDGEIGFEPDPVLAETVNLRFAGLEPVRLEDSSRSKTVSESAAPSAVVPSWTEEDLPEEHTLAEYREEADTEAVDRSPDDVEGRESDGPEAEDTDVERAQTGVKGTQVDAAGTGGEEAEGAETYGADVEGAGGAEAGEAAPQTLAPEVGQDAVDEFEDVGTPDPTETSRAQGPEDDDFAEVRSDEPFGEPTADEPFGDETADDEAAPLAELSFDDGEEDATGAPEPQASDLGHETGTPPSEETPPAAADDLEPEKDEGGTAPDRHARPHETIRRDWPSERADRRGLDGTTSRRNTILIGAGLLIVIAAAVVGYFAVQPTEPSETAVTPDEPVVSENGAAPEGTTPTDTAATAAGDAVDQPPESDIPTDADQPVSTPLRSSDGIDPSAGGFTIVVYSERNEGTAQDVAEEYAGEGFRAGVVRSDEGGASRYRVGIGQFESLEAAMAARNELAGTELPDDAWVYRIE